MSARTKFLGLILGLIMVAALIAIYAASESAGRFIAFGLSGWALALAGRKMAALFTNDTPTEPVSRR